MKTDGLVLVVDDDRSVRTSLGRALRSAGYTVEAFEGARQLLARLPTVEVPCCIVSDVRMPGMDGLTLLRRLRAAGSSLPLMLITGHGDVAMAVTAMKSGAVDFLEKPFDADIARRALQKLTSRESEVFERLVTGKSNKEIAVELGISPRTVEFHRAHIMEKMAAKGLPDLVRLWLSRNVPQSAP